MKRFLASLGIWVLATGWACAFVAPQSQGFVTDVARVLNDQDKAVITQLAASLEKQTGIEMAVVTVPDLHGEPVEDAAVALFESWGIGKKDQDNGLLILLSKNDRKIRVEVGYGLEGILPDGKVGRIIDDYALPAFRQGQYGQGLTNLSLALADTLAKAYKVELPYQSPQQPTPQLDKRVEWIMTVLLFVIFLGLFGTRGGRRLLPWLLLGTLLGGSHRRHHNDFGGFGGGGFGGFGGGMSGGGGAGRGW
ncbi:MAG: TPM domain-containing protein [Candidatus Margulisiibacteriota bacterium]